MAQNIKTRIANLLLSKKKHTRYVGIVACMALIVTLGVVASLRQSGIAMTHEETVLDCHYDGGGAHTHNADCYDGYGNLVCPLAERELHVHDDSCYTTETHLVCGLDEYEGHTHTDACYDEEGNLVCGQEESEGHTHTDACYETTRTLTCGKEEVTEEHVHGPGCFKTITVKDEEPAKSTDTSETKATTEKTKADPNAEMPAQVFDHQLKDEHGKVVLTVHVEAPEGAFPKGTTMHVKPVEAKDIQDAVDRAVADKTDAKVTDIQAVDITFRNKDNQEIEPATNITVELKSALIAENDDPYIVHVDDKGKADVVDTLDDRQIVEHDMKPEDDKLVFDSDKFSTYSIVITSLHGTLTASDGQTYDVDVDVPAAAGIPQGSELEVREIVEGAEGYDAYREAAANMVDGDLSYARFFDISIVKDGQKVQPEEQVQVKISLHEDSAALSENMQVLHFADKSTTAEPVESTLDGDQVSFGAKGFSVYAVVGTGDNGENARMTVKFYGKDQNNPIATVYVKNDDDYAALQDIAYDPGVDGLADNELFKGWIIGKPNYTTADAENAMDIEDIQTWAANRTDIVEGEEVKIYAMIYKTYAVTFKDESGVTIKSEALIFKANEGGTSYTIDQAYTPKEQDEAFLGWYTSGDVTASTQQPFANGTEVTIRSNAVFTPSVPKGNWLIFNENGDNADYTPPQFIQTGNNTEKPSDPTRFGYVFGGWYTDEDCTAGNEFTFGQELTGRTTLYAKWTPVTNSNYTIIIWKQNLDASGYDYAESMTLSGRTGTAINTVRQQGTGDNAYARVNGTNKQYTGFHLKEFDQNVTITPEGDAVLNVYYDRTEYTLRFFYARSYTYNYHTYIQVNCNNEGFLQGKDKGRTLNQSLTHRVENDYQLKDGGNTWKDVNNTDVNGNPLNLISAAYLAKPEVTTGSININSVATDVVTGRNSSTNTTRNMTYYFFDVKVRYEQDLRQLWPTPNLVFETQDLTSYNRGNSGYSTVSPLLQGSWSTGKNLGGTYSVLDMRLFESGETTANLITYWRYERPLYYQYNVYFSALDGETDTTSYKGKEYVLQNDLSYIVANGQGWKDSGAPTDDGKGYWDVESVTFNGTEIVGRVDIQSEGSINVYYERIVRSINYNDGIYVDGNGNTINSNVTHQLHTKRVTYGTDLSSYNEGEDNYWRPDDTDQYVFEGWYMDSEGRQPYTFTGTMPMQDITIYAKWRQVQYRVFLHPNVPASDKTFDMGGQNTSFRADYGEKIAGGNQIPATRDEYELIGWYTDEACTKAFNFDAYVLNDTIVTTPYNQTEPTELDLYGNPTESGNKDAANNRFWITHKLDLYAKWRSVIDGAPGINIQYDAVDGKGTFPGGTTTKLDPLTYYLDRSEANAYAASNASDTNEHFLHWVVQRWDNSQGKYVDTEEIVYPGDIFEVRKDYAKVEDIDNPTDPNVTKTYTVQLRAEYGDKDTPTPTHITWYANNGTGATVTNEHLQINEAVDIKSATTFRRDGYNFLGWARKVEVSDEAGVVQTIDGVSPANLDKTYTEADLFLKWDGQKYVATANTEGVTAGTEVKQIAADEDSPYHGMVAVWEKKMGYLKIGKHFDVQEFYLDGEGMESKWNILRLWITDADGNYVKLKKETTGDNAGNYIYDGIVTAAEVAADPSKKPTFVLSEFKHETTQQNPHEHQYLAYAWLPYGTYTVHEDETEAKDLLKNYGYTRVGSNPYEASGTVNAGTYGDTTNIGGGEARIDNNYRGEQAEIRVTKATAGNTAVSSDKTFYFVVKNKALNAYVSTDENTFTTNVSKIKVFEITKDQTVKVTVISNAEYEIIELSADTVPAATESPEIAGTDWTVAYSSTAIKPVKDGADATNAVTITNTYMRPGVDVYLNKVEKGKTSPLPGSEFTLLRKNEQNHYAEDSSISYTTGTLELTNGELKLEALPVGDYKLTETKAPDGYLILTKDIYFTVQVATDGNTSVIIPTTGQESYTATGASVKQTTAKDDTLVIPNTPGQALPHTGGIGTTIFSITGTALIAGASAYGIAMRRKRERRFGV